MLSLPSVPSSVDLSLKASASGVIYLKQGRYRSRYTGNKNSAVDINGKLWLKAADLKAAIKSGNTDKKRPKNKKARVETQAVESFTYLNSGQISENFSTHTPELLTEIPNLPTLPPKTYTVNKKEVRQRILGYMNTQKGKKELFFWTVTFPPAVDDNTAYQAYNTWLTRLRQLKMLKEYIWIAERQEKGTIHFHIAVPHYMNVHRANAQMRGTLKNLARKGVLNMPADAFRKYNGVDIAKNRKNGQPHKVLNFAGNKKGARALTGYLTKYLTKNDTAFTHLAWHNSRGYSSIFTGVTFTLNEFRANGMYGRIDVSKRFENEYFVFVPWWGEPPKKLMEHLYEINSGLQSVYDGADGFYITTLSIHSLKHKN